MTDRRGGATPEEAPLGLETYTVLDLAGPGAAEVRNIRRRHGYDFLGALPVEITMTGSSGLGCPEPGQKTRDLLEELDAVAADTTPIIGRFGPVVRFPETDIFVLTFEDEEPFHRLHERLRNTRIRWASSPFTFTPHCTLRQWPTPSAAEAEELLSVSIDGGFRCDLMSTYTITSFPILELRHRAHLTGSA